MDPPPSARTSTSAGPNNNCTNSPPSPSTNDNTMCRPSACPTTTTPLKTRQTAWWQNSVVRRSSSAVDDAVGELTEKSRFLLKRKMIAYGRSNSSDSTTSENHQIARFHRDEIWTGKLLGEGTFSVVYQVLGFDVRKSKRTASFDDGKDDSCAIVENADSFDDEVSLVSLDSLQNNLRQDVVRQYCCNDEDDEDDDPSTTTTSQRRYFALKHLKPDLLVKSKDFEQAATDLVMEGRYLAYLDHPHILKLRGWAVGGTAAFSSSGYHGYFLLTDRLKETLAKRIDRWKDLGDDHAQRTNTILHKTRYAQQICSALVYLHQQRIIFRDLKPSNMGFLDDETIQLFDFGLCRELPRTNLSGSSIVGVEEDISSTSYEEDVEDTNDQYQDDNEKLFLMSGAGTLCYMAPECLRENKYNLKADVYSWAMTYYEMLVLAKPFPSYTVEEHMDYVVVDGDRPPLYQDDGERVLPWSIQNLLEQAWTGEVSQRLTMRQVGEQLQDIVQSLEHADDRSEPPLLDDSLYYEDERLRRLAYEARSCCGVLQRWCRAIARNVLTRVSVLCRQIVNGLRTSLPPQEEEVQGEIALQEHPQMKNDEDVTAVETPYTLSVPTAHRQSLLYSRKPSSMSTTTITTDDGCDDDTYTAGTSSYGTLSKQVSSMEALLEGRHCPSEDDKVPRRMSTSSTCC